MGNYRTANVVKLPEAVLKEVGSDKANSVAKSKLRQPCSHIFIAWKRQQKSWQDVCVNKEPRQHLQVLSLKKSFAVKLPAHIHQHVTYS